MKKGLWKSSLVTMTMLTSLTAPLLVSTGSTVMADSSQPQSIYVAGGTNGLSASVGNSYTNSSRPSLDRAYRALGDPGKVGASINQQIDLKQVKQTARQSLQAYGQKASDYLNDQNLSDHAKTELQTQLKQVLTVADANLDQSKTLNQVVVALHTGAYGVLATASATTVSQANTDTKAAQFVEKNVGDNSSAMATGYDDKVADLMKSTDADHEIDVDTTKNDNNQQLVDQYQQFLTQMSQKLDQYLKANGQNINDDKNVNHTQSNSSLSSSSQSGQNNGNNSVSGQPGTDVSNAGNDNGEQPGKGKNFTSVQAMIQYLNGQHGKDKLNSVKGATVETTIKMTHKAEGDYKTIFADNDGTLFLSKTGYNNIKPGQKVKVMIDSVAEGSANSPLGESVGWYDYTVTFSDLSIVNDAANNKQANNGNGQGQNGGSNAGQTTPNQYGNSNGNQAGASGNAPAGSVIPQTGQSKLNAWLSAVGISLMGLFGIGAGRKIKKDQN